MTKKQLSKRDMEQVGDPEIYAAIGYLEPDPKSANEKNDDTAFIICVSVGILLLGCLAFLELYFLVKFS
jgi:hypothetical protein